MRHLFLLMIFLAVSYIASSQPNEDSVFWLRETIKTNARVDKFGTEEYVVKIDSCILSVGQTQKIVMPSVGTDVFRHVYTLYIKDIFLIQTEVTNRDYRIKIRTKKEFIRHYWPEADKRDTVDEILLMFNKDAYDNGAADRINALFKSIVKSCGGQLTIQ